MHLLNVSYGIGTILFRVCFVDQSSFCPGRQQCMLKSEQSSYNNRNRNVCGNNNKKARLKPWKTSYVQYFGAKMRSIALIRTIVRYEMLLIPAQQTQPFTINTKHVWHKYANFCIPRSPSKECMCVCVCREHGIWFFDFHLLNMIKFNWYTI